MAVLNEEHTKTVVGATDVGYLPGLGRVRVARELFRGRFRPRQSVQLREIAAEYQLDHESVLKIFSDFQALGMVTLSGNLSAIVRSPDPQETEEAYQIRAAIEEIAGRTAASVLKGYTGELRNEVEVMRAAIAGDDLDAFAGYEGEIVRIVVKVMRNQIHLW